MSIRRLIALSIVILVGWVPPLVPQVSGAAQATRPPQVTCASCLVLEEGGEVLWGRRIQARRPMASATKMITALVALEEADLDEVVTVSPFAAGTPGGRLSLEPGDRLTVKDLLRGLLIASSNDGAVALAEHVSGSESAFVSAMNAAAEALGAEGTSFVTSHGMDEPGHVSSARDLARFGAALLKEPLLAEIVATERTVITVSGRAVDIENTNELLGEVRGLDGIKTGYTLNAGQVLVASAERQGRRLISVAMGSDDVLEDSRRLLEHGFRMLRAGTLLRRGDPLGAVVFGDAANVTVVAGRRVTGLPRKETVSVEFVADDDLVTPVYEGDTVGRAIVRVGDRVVGEAHAVATSNAPRESRSWMTDLMATTLRTAARVLPSERS